MMDVSEIRRRNVKHLIETVFDDSLPAFAKHIGKAESQIRRIFYRGENARNLGNTAARLIEDKCRKPKGWMDAPQWSDEQSVSESTQNYHIPEPKQVILWENLEDLPEGEFLLVGRIDVEAAAGSGRTNGDFPEERDKIAYRADWLKGSKAKSTNLKSIKASGDSMHPTIFDGDDVLLDLSQNTIENGKVYAFIADGEVKIKRLYRQSKVIVAHSDNETDPQYRLDQEYSNSNQVRIIGRVVNRSGAGNL